MKGKIADLRQMVRYIGVSLLLKASFMKRMTSSTLDPKLEHVKVIFDTLPPGFENIRILFLTDLHADGECGLAEKLLRLVSELDYDYCVLGGDYTCTRGGDCGVAYSEIGRIAKGLAQRSKVFAVLGNYDLYSMAEMLMDCGVKVLINEGVPLERNGDKIYLTGLDDCSHNIEVADRMSWDRAFKVMVCHSPAKYREAARAGYSMYLAGHTHGGQICLLGSVAMMRRENIPRKMVRGKWVYGSMVGYTSRGIGTSVIAARVFCPPEITVLTLCRQNSS